jgi:hypothetical protein
MRAMDWSFVEGAWRRNGWVVQEYFLNTSKPWVVYLFGRMVTRRHGIYSGYWRFATAENAMRAITRERRRASAGRRTKKGEAK